jgi:glycosyltransferase involved in cell wall biosynthesis
MKLLLISADFPPVPSGEANHAFYLANHLGLAGVETHVLTSIRSNAATCQGAFTLHPIMQNWSWRQTLPFIKFVKRIAPDTVLLVFLGEMYHNHPLMTLAPTICRAIVPTSRFVTQFEHLGVQTWSMPRVTRLVRKLALQWAGPRGADYQYGTLLRDSHRVIVLSEMHRTTLARSNPEINDKCTLIPPPPLMSVAPEWRLLRDPTRKLLGFRSEDFVLIYYGYIYPSKGVEYLLDAVRLLRLKGLPVKLLMVGGFRQHNCSAKITKVSMEYEQQMKQRPAALGIAEDVIWTGNCPPDGGQASGYFAAADTCVLPFDSGVHLNNSSIACAAAHEIPLVTTSCESTESIFQDGHNVKTCPPKDAAALSWAIEAVVENSSLRSRLRRGASELARDWFCWETAVRRTIAAMTDVSWDESVAERRFGQSEECRSVGTGVEDN